MNTDKMKIDTWNNKKMKLTTYIYSLSDISLN